MRIRLPTLPTMVRGGEVVVVVVVVVAAVAVAKEEVIALLQRVKLNAISQRESGMKSHDKEICSFLEREPCLVDFAAHLFFTSKCPLGSKHDTGVDV